MILTENNRRTGRKTCPSGSLSSTNATWTNLGSKPCLRGNSPANNSLSQDTAFNPLNAELNPICHLLALLGAHHIFHVSGLRVKDET